MSKNTSFLMNNCQKGEEKINHYIKKENSPELSFQKEIKKNINNILG